MITFPRARLMVSILSICALSIVAYMVAGEEKSSAVTDPVAEHKHADGDERPATDAEIQAALEARGTTTDPEWQEEIDEIESRGGSWAQIPNGPVTDFEQAYCEGAPPGDVMCASVKASANGDLAPGIYEQGALEKELAEMGYLR